MDYLGLFVLFVLLAYLSTSYSAYREVLEKDMKVRLTFDNVIFFLVIPIRVSLIHLKMVIRFHRNGQKTKAKVNVALATFKISSGVAIYLEIIAHSSTVGENEMI
ncbi:hypothetical protein ACIGEH_11205 [Bacillus altitudinis]|uniref:hypothetical protein n=1 Tax=Bacillus altitudinis TaxID=293387 RepID=UPI0037C54449